MAESPVAQADDIARVWAGGMDEQAVSGPFFITRQNFVDGESLPVEPRSTLLLFFFERGDLVSKRNTDTGFRNMSRDLRVILKILCYAAHSCDGSRVFLVYLEPWPPLCAGLSPPMRCSLTNDFCLVFVIPPQMSAVQTVNFDFGADEGGDGGADDPGGDMIRLLVDAAKRLICMDVNLVAPTGAFVMRNSRDRTAELLAQFDFAQWTYRADVLDKRGGAAKGAARHCMDKPLQTADTTLTRNSLGAAIPAYFRGRAAAVRAGGGRGQSPWHAEGLACSSAGPEELLDCLFVDMGVAEKSPVFARYRRAFPTSPYCLFLQQLAQAASSWGAPPVASHNLIVFSYSIEHLINKDNFTLFEQAPFFRYHRPPACSVSWGEEEEEERAGGPEGEPGFGRYVGAMIAAQSVDSVQQQDRDLDFRLNWPHLYTFKKIVAQVSAGSRSAPLELLRVKVGLFKSTVLDNAANVATQPSKGLCAQLALLLDNPAAGVAPLVALKAGKMARFQCLDPRRVPRTADYMFVSLVFVTVFGLTRCTQAFLSLTHILHTTAPKWKPERLMLINHTRGGTGKTHTMGVFRRLFSGVPELFGGFSSFTDTVFKYSEMCIGKVMVLDDIGLSQGQQKGSRREDSGMNAQLKSLLDAGYTNNVFTEKDPRTSGGFRVSNRLMVFNSAFIWNTNTMETFSEALLDRCVVICGEPVSAPPPGRARGQLEAEVQRYRLEERFRGLFLRQHLLQTLLFTACPADGQPGERALGFLAQTVATMSARFPVARNTSSLLRSEAKLMDMVMAEAVRLAVGAVLDWWIPPWTVAPQLQPAERSREYMRRLDAARVAAFRQVDLGELLVETAAQLKLFIPSAVVEAAALHFNQSTGGIFSLVYGVLDKAVAYNARDVFVAGETSNEGATLMVNHVGRACPEIFELDKKQLQAGQDLWFRWHGRNIKLVEEVTATGLRLNAFFALELFKLHGRAHLERTFDFFYRLFGEQLKDDGRLRPVTLGKGAGELTVRNVLRLLRVVNTEAHPNQPELAGGEAGDDFYVAPHFMGVATELYLRRAADDPLQPPLSAYGPHLNAAYRGGSCHDPAPDRADPPAYSFYQPRVSWLSVGYLQGLVRESFQHARCGLMPLGDSVGFYAADHRPEDDEAYDSWEYDEARAIYANYLCDYPLRSPAEHGRDLCRYLCCAGDPQAEAALDPYLSRLRAELPAAAEEAAGVLRSRYGPQPDRREDRRRRAEPPAQPEGSFAFKRTLTSAGALLLAQMKRRAEK